MGLRQREWAYRTVQRMKLTLGYRCAVCGTRRHLEFDCIVPQGDRHHKIEWSWRISFYREQLRKGNLQLLCKHHNAIKSALDKLSYTSHP